MNTQAVYKNTQWECSANTLCLHFTWKMKSIFKLFLHYLPILCGSSTIARIGKWRISTALRIPGLTPPNSPLFISGTLSVNNHTISSGEAKTSIYFSLSYGWQCVWFLSHFRCLLQCCDAASQVLQQPPDGWKGKGTVGTRLNLPTLTLPTSDKAHNFQPGWSRTVWVATAFILKDLSMLWWYIQ